MSAAATTTAEAERAPTHLLDLPNGMIERILVATSDDGNWRGLGNARLVCRRLNAAAFSAAREFVLRLTFPPLRRGDDQLAPLALLPRLSALKRLQVFLAHDYECCTDEDPFDAVPAMAAKIARAVRE
jgi:hypothetical protein